MHSPWIVPGLNQIHTVHMVQYPDEYSCRRWLMAALRPPLQKEVLRRGITVEFSNMKDILEKPKDIKDSSWYDIGLRIANDIIDVTLTAYRPMVKTSIPMFYQAQKTSGLTQRNPKPISHPQMTAKVSNSCHHIPSGMGAPWKEGELHCYECGQKGHIKPQCPKVKGKQQVARVQIEDLIEEDEEALELTNRAPNHTLDKSTYVYAKSWN